VLQIYFRKLGGATVDTPDLGPVTKLGMGRREGEAVQIPKAAASLPELGSGRDDLAAEFGAAMPAVPVPSMLSTPPAAGPGENGASEDGAWENGNGAPRGASNGAAAAGEGSEAETDSDDVIVGGLQVAESEMEGVAKDELEYLGKRCKRQKQAA
jgi:hypothetical protein